MEQVKLFFLICKADGEMRAKLANLENEVNAWLKSKGEAIEIVRILKQSHYEYHYGNNVILYSIFYKERYKEEPKTKTEAPPEIRINRNAY